MLPCSHEAKKLLTVARPTHVRSVKFISTFFECEHCRRLPLHVSVPLWLLRCFSLQTMERVRTVIHPASPALDTRRTSAQSVPTVCQTCLLSYLQQQFTIFLQVNGFLSLFCAAVDAFVVPPVGRFLTLQQTCVSKCPTGFFASRLSGVCEECPPGCLQCVNAELCSRCLNSRRTLLFLQDGKCVQECVRSAVIPNASFFSGILKIL